MKLFKTVSGVLLSSTLLLSFSTGASAITPGVPTASSVALETVTKEIPNVKVINIEEQSGSIGIMSLLASGTLSFNGQGNTTFTFKSNGTDELVRVYVKNNGGQSVHYKLISPSGTTWIDTWLDSGSQYLTEHIFSAPQGGQWTMDFSNADGSYGTVDYSVRDGL